MKWSGMKWTGAEWRGVEWNRVYLAIRRYGGIGACEGMVGNVTFDKYGGGQETNG